MAILKFKKLIEDLENNTTQVLASVTKPASTASYAGTSLKATSAGDSGTAYKATSAGNAGTSLIAHYGSSGTGKLAGTHALYQSGGQGF